MSVSVEGNLSTEVPKGSAELERIRGELAQSRGLAVDSTPVELTDDQAADVKEGFGVPSQDRARAKAETSKRWAKDALGSVAKKRYDLGALSEVAGGVKADQTVELIRPTQASTESEVSEVDRQGAVVARTFAVEDAAKFLGAESPQSLEAALSEATVDVYSSPQNGAPVLTERVISLPGGTIHEMNLHPVGSDETIDTQVVVTA